MKKIKQLINTVYRICLVNPGGRKRYVNYREESGMETGLISDSLLRQIVSDDQLQLEADPQIREILHQRVKTIDLPPGPARNSMLDIFLPLFSSQHIEIKMALVSLALFVLIGLGPKSSQAPDRKIHLFFLADTLGDSSSFHHPAAQDTAFRVQYK